MSRASRDAGPAASPRTPWLPPQLAAVRARSVGALRYDIEIEIDAGARYARGRQAIELDLAARAARRELVLDWRPEQPSRAREGLRGAGRVNGLAMGAVQVGLSEGHLRIPASALRPGRNRIELAWQAPIAPAGTPLVRYRDPRDGSLYVHTLFVPAEASRVFPCFDQPDLKACFCLTLALPGGWQAIGNAPLVRSELRDGVRKLAFAPTEPISTYLFAFAAGPFAAVLSRRRDAKRDGTLPQGRVWVRRSLKRTAARACADVMALDVRALRFCVRYFGHPFPFAKYDFVLVPQFPFRGMEHAGATFLAERDVMLDARADALQRLERAQLVFHETAHQWMGNLLTMRSFADLWMKEGFANFIAYELAARVVSRADADIAFLRLALTAQHVNSLPHAPALHNALRDAAHAKWAYGPVVYAKAPALLRDLQARLGARRFRAGVRRFVRRHAYAAADWRELLAALESPGGASRIPWARAGILRAGAARGRGSFDSRTGATRLPSPGGSEFLRELAGRGMRSPQRRLQAWSSAWQALRARTLAPQRLLELLLDRLEAENNLLLLRWLLQRTAELMDRLLPDAGAHASALDALLLRQLRRPAQPLTAVWLEGLIATARTAPALEALERVARGQWAANRYAPTGHRTRAAIALVARGAWRGRRALHALGTERLDRGVRLQVAAAAPDAAGKRVVLERLLATADLPDTLLLAAVETLNHPAHARQIVRLLPSALRALPALAHRRAVFFAERWIAAFASAQASRQAASAFERYAREPFLAAPLRDKLLQAASDIGIAAAIRGEDTQRANRKLPISTNSTPTRRLKPL